MRPAAQTFEDLIVWQKAHAFVLEIYLITESFPKSELYGLTSQLRRSTVSIPANLAEGFKKRSPADKMRFFNTAQGSPEESRYYLILAHDLKYMDSSQLRHRLDEVARLLNAYSMTVRASVV